MRTARHVALGVWVLAALGLAGLCFVWPTGTALREVFSHEAWEEAALSARRLRLLSRGLGIAAAAAVIALALGAGLAAGLGSRRGEWGRSLGVWVGLIVLLTPPYIYAYAWSLVLLPGGLALGAPGAVFWPSWLVHEGRAAWCLGTWTAPVAAVVLASGWRVSGRPAYTLALPDATPWQAVRCGAFRAMLPWMVVALLVAALLALTEHSVCDLSQAPTWNTEVFAILQSFGAPGPILAWPLVALVAALLLALWPFRTTLRRLLEDMASVQAPDDAAGASAAGGRALRLVAFTVTVAVLFLPALILVSAVREPRALLDTWKSFPMEWPHGLRYAAGCAVVSIALAIGVDAAIAAGRGLWRAVGRVVLLLAAVAAIVPGALVGDAFAAAYVNWPVIRDHWGVVSLVTAARFAIVPILALRLAGRTTDAELIGMASLDGAGRLGAYFRVRLARSAPALTAAGVIAALLALTEVPASHMVCPPGVGSVALRLFNHIHYGRNDEIVAMALYLMLFVAVVVTGARVLAVLRRSPTGRQPS